MSIPIIVGAGQAVQRRGSIPLDQALGPIELMVEAARQAGEDAGVPALLAKVEWIGVAGGWWKHQDPGSLVASALGAQHARTALAAISGTAPQDLLALAAERIAAGQLDVALVLGGEAEWSTRRLRMAGQEPTWAVDAGTRAPNWNAGEGPVHPEAVGGFPAIVRREGRVFGAAVTAYALFEDSMRSSAGRTAEEQRDVAAALVSRFSQVASGNPFAWDHRVLRGRGAGAHRGQPDGGVPLHEGHGGQQHGGHGLRRPAVQPRRGPCLRDRGGQAHLPARRGVEQRDLGGWAPSGSARQPWPRHRRPRCFRARRHHPRRPGACRPLCLLPAIVQMSTSALGLDPARQLTLTGGLMAAGAPVGNATGQSLAAMVAAARDGGAALVHGNGGNATKHCVGLYGAEPPSAGFRRITCPDDQAGGELLPAEWHGQVTVEAATVVYDREGPLHVFAAVSDEAGRRGFATSADSDLLDAAHGGTLTGRQLTLSSSGGLHG